MTRKQMAAQRKREYQRNLNYMLQHEDRADRIYHLTTSKGSIYRFGCDMLIRLIARGYTGLYHTETNIQIR